MRTYALDTNCFIDAVNTASPHHDNMKRLMAAYRSGKVSLKVSLHVLHQLREKPDSALDIAETLQQLPHLPIGAWNKQVGTWQQLTGTWDDANQNERIQIKLKKLANSGTDIRDRGAYIDALCSNLDGFITSDKQLVGSGPVRKINERFSTKVLTPEQAVEELGV